jgi:colanic acid/amylovoran biosynthesis glycosyltransferase
VMLEAMAAGRGIVASRLPGIDEVLEDGSSGLLVPAGDARELAWAIDRLLADESLRASLGEAARLRAEEGSVESRGARYIEIIRAAAGR